MFRGHRPLGVVCVILALALLLALAPDPVAVGDDDGDEFVWLENIEEGLTAAASNGKPVLAIFR